MFASSNSPGPADNVYNGTGPGHAPDTGYVTANSPQPNPFPAIPINRVSSQKEKLIIALFNSYNLINDNVNERFSSFELQEKTSIVSSLIQFRKSSYFHFPRKQEYSNDKNLHSPLHQNLFVK